MQSDAFFNFQLTGVRAIELGLAARWRGPRHRSRGPDDGRRHTALLFAVAYGVFMGSYPVPIKTRAVLEADVHPLIFQSFKSFWVFVTGFLALIPVYASHRSFEFTWWGVASAASWVPSGFCTICGVTYIGLSMTIVISCASNAILSFLVFWLVFDEDIKQHEINGHEIYLAPAYLAAIVVGMVGLVYAPKLNTSTAAKTEPSAGTLSVPPASTASRTPDLAREMLMPVANDSHAIQATGAPERKGGLGVQLLGMLAGLGSGVFGAVQYGCVNAGKRYERHKAGCADDPDSCPAALREQFDNFGSWMVSFGLGAALVTLSFLTLLSAGRRVLAGKPPPQLHLKVMRVPGSTAGLCWALANFCGTAANARGGSAITMAQMSAIQLVTSGLWGLFYYGEIRGRAMYVWALCAVWTIGAIVLLGLEKGA